MNKKAFLRIIMIALIGDCFFLSAKARSGAAAKTQNVAIKTSSPAKRAITTQPIIVQEKAKPTVQSALVTQQPKPTTLGSKLSLEQIHTEMLSQKPASQSTIPTKSKSILPAQITTDLFTQSQAHMSVPEVKKLITSTYNIKPYERLIASVIAREKEYQDEYVFYHGIDNVWRVPQDLYTKLYAHFNSLSANLMKDFIFLRFEDVRGPSSVQNFLVTQLTQSGLMNDHPMGLFLIAANLALFGNVGVQPECTWQYFIKSRGHANPSRVTYEKIMDRFGLTHKYIDELMKLVDLYQTKEQTILQIFIPENKVDTIGYLAWIRGMPAHQKTMNMVLRSVDDKTFPKTAPALDYYTKIFKKEQEANPIFKNLIDRVKAGDFSLSYFLTFYRNRPNEIEDINNFQARLIVTPELLLNPLSGVKMFRYSMATPEQLKKYEQKLNAIIDKILADSLHTGTRSK